MVHAMMTVAAIYASGVAVAFCWCHRHVRPNEEALRLAFGWPGAVRDAVLSGLGLTIMELRRMVRR